MASPIKASPRRQDMSEVTRLTGTVQRVGFSPEKMAKTPKVKREDLDGQADRRTGGQADRRTGGQTLGRPDMRQFLCSVENIFLTPQTFSES